MQWKVKLASVAFGAALLAGITIPAASASAGPSITAASNSGEPFCNFTSGGDVYGCAVSGGLAKAVTLAEYPGKTTPTDFTYNSADEIVQAGTDWCLNYNPDSSTYPVNMNTCNGSQYELWTHPIGIKLGEWFNIGATTCLEGDENGIFNKPLVMDPCGDDYAGQVWALR